MKANKKMKITVEQQMVMNRTVNRTLELANGLRINHHKAHKMATDYNRKKEKRVNFDD